MKGGKVLGALGIVAVIILAFLLVTSPGFQSMIDSMFSMNRSYPEEVRTELIRELSIDANGGEIINYKAEVPVPQEVYFEGELVQHVVSFSSDPAVSSIEVNGTEWLQWDGGALSGEQSFTATLGYEMVLRSHVWNLDETDSLDIDDIPLTYTETYLSEEWLIDPDLPEVKVLSEQIVGQEEDVYLALKAIYDWMTENVEYPTFTGSSPQDPATTLQTMVGDCDDQSILFCSLARAANIPAWLQVGLLYDQSSGVWGGHAWVQTYIPTEDGGEEVVIDTVNNEFLIWDPYRILEFTSDGDGEHLNEYYQYFHCHIIPSSYPQGGGPAFSQEFLAVSYEEYGDEIVLLA